VLRVDLEHGQDVRLFELPKKPVHGILAAPPCTVFANSGARWPRTDDDMREGLSVVDACLRIVVATKPLWWVLENPAGKLKPVPGAAGVDVPAERVRRPVHEVHVPVGQLLPAREGARAGDDGLQDASAAAVRGPRGAAFCHPRRIREGLL
jgi:hypothetical protein